LYDYSKNDDIRMLYELSIHHLTAEIISSLSEFIMCECCHQMS